MKVNLHFDIRQKGVKSKKIEIYDVPNKRTKKAINKARRNKTIKVKRKSNDVFEDILNA